MVEGSGRQPLGILPHGAFKQIAGGARFDTYRRDPRMRVADENAFSEMQAHIDKLYAGVDAVHSFEDASGHIFDCIPIEQQPSLRGHGGALPQPPDLRPVLQGKAAVQSTPVAMAAAPHIRLDRHGNRMQAPAGTIPMRRVTLDEMCRFRDLRHFLRKHPSISAAASDAAGKTGSPGQTSPLQAHDADMRTQPSTPDPDSGKNHRYAYTHQTVDNIGGNSSLAVYAPPIDTNQIFSLSQHWYTSGAGTGHQTLEVGWQVYPEKYGHALPVLFIFWTADNYASTGAYNLDAPGFVQTNGAWTIGGALSPASTQGGQQMEIEAAVYLYNGNWWLYMGGLAAENTIGYYPTSIYNGGAMATKATSVLFGGETVCRTVSWPAMGSGANASAGWQQAAYQRNIFYFPPGGGAQWTTLTPEQPSPACYTLALAKAAAPWGVYFFYGGPGGGDC
jgi:hypothetical protein